MAGRARPKILVIFPREQLRGLRLASPDAAHATLTLLPFMNPRLTDPENELLTGAEAASEVHPSMQRADVYVPNMTSQLGEND